MARYHVNPATGNPGICTAEVACPFGGDLVVDHYGSAQEARKAFEGQNNPWGAAPSPQGKPSVGEIQEDFSGPMLNAYEIYLEAHPRLDAFTAPEDEDGLPYHVFANGAYRFKTDDVEAVEAAGRVANAGAWASAESLEGADAWHMLGEDLRRPVDELNARAGNGYGDPVERLSASVAINVLVHESENGNIINPLSPRPVENPPF